MSLEIIFGSMFSGKSTELIRRARRLRAINKKVVVINHSLDTRYGEGSAAVSTHYGDSIEARRYSYLKDFSTTDDLAVDTICIDEAHFFADLHVAVRELLKKGKHVIVAGLTGDYQRNNFGLIHKLIPIAETITHLRAYCGLCNDGTLASFTKRLVKTDSVIDVGSKDKYVAVCGNCWS